jgi:glycosyltransferase involved in cell wall biosynthesis
MNPAPALSIVIPAFNRLEPLRHTLRSAAAAARALGEPVEILLVDDGSSPPLLEQLAAFEAGAPFTVLRQANQGSMIARLAGLRAATGEYVLFLDSDDLVRPDKLTRQLAAMRAAGAEISYSDMADYVPGPGGEPVFGPGERLRTTADALEFFLQVQPVPHNPIYRRDYLRRHLDAPLVAARREFDPVGDVWIYYNLLIHPVRIAKVDEPLTAIGRHEDDRYSRHWEKLGVASLQLMEAFAAACPRTPATRAARVAAGECAFNSWRRLPKDFDRRFDARMLALWRQAPRGPRRHLGGRLFQALAAVAGPAGAGRLLRRWRGGTYAACRSLSPEEYQRLFASF